MPQRLLESQLRIDRRIDESEDRNAHQVQVHAKGSDRDKANLEYGRDYDRILYSGAFRKLEGVTQVVSFPTWERFTIASRIY